MPRHLIVGQARHLIEIHAIGHREHTVFGTGDVLGVAVAALRKLARAHKYFLPDRQFGTARAGLHHRAAHFNAGYRRQRRHPAIDAFAHQRFRHAHADGVRLDQNLAGLGFRRGQIDVFQNIGAAGFEHLDGFHGFPCVVLFDWQWM